MEDILCPYKPCGSCGECAGCAFDPKHRKITKEKFLDTVSESYQRCTNCRYFVKSGDNINAVYMCHRIDGKHIAVCKDSLGNLSKTVCQDFYPNKNSLWAFRHWQPEFVVEPNDYELAGFYVDGDEKTLYYVSAKDFFYHRHLNEDNSLKWIKCCTEHGIVYADEGLNRKIEVKENERLPETDLKKLCAWWNDKKDMTAILYGDLTDISWNKSKYEQWKNSTGTASNIEAVDAYIYKVYGDYSVYRTLIGEIKVKADGEILLADLTLKYRGKNYNLIYFNMYGKRFIDIKHFSLTYVAEWCNTNTLSLQHFFPIKELDIEIVEKLLSKKLKAFGYSIQCAMDECRKIFNSNRINCVC